MDGKPRLPEGRTYSPLPLLGGSGGISCGNRALYEVDAAPAGASGQCRKPSLSALRVEKKIPRILFSSKRK